jgi:ferredoxin
LRGAIRHNRKGYIGTIWFGPFPYVNNLCSCESPECAGIRPRVDFGIRSIYKAEYAIDVRDDACMACGACVDQCPFGAITMDKGAAEPDPHDPRTWRVTPLWPSLCTGCGDCVTVCPQRAIEVRFGRRAAIGRSANNRDAGRAAS